MRGHAGVVRLLLAEGASVDPNASTTGGNGGGGGVNTALDMAAQNGHAKAVAALLADERVDAARTGRWGGTVLTYVSEK